MIVALFFYSFQHIFLRDSDMERTSGFSFSLTFVSVLWFVFEFWTEKFQGTAHKQHSFLSQYFHRKLSLKKLKKCVKTPCKEVSLASKTVFEMLMFPLSWNFIMITVVCMLNLFKCNRTACFFFFQWLYNFMIQIGRFKAVQNIYEYMYFYICMNVCASI